MTYYNELDPYAADWLRNLSDAGHIAKGRVDDRSIEDVQPEDIGDGQAHFFAGIGLWSVALRWAGWPDGATVWTGSCPCQPFSSAGTREGADDARHLWPTWFRLIEQRRPPVIFGEQVASADGRAWFAAVRADLETLGYSVGAADMCAAGVGAPHVRQRLFWGARLANSDGIGLDREQACSSETGRGLTADDDGDGGMANPDSARPQGRVQCGHGANQRAARQDGVVDGLGHTHRERCERDRSVREWLPEEPRSCPVDWLNVDYLPCSDGPHRPTQPGIHPLADGGPGRVARLRAYGNAIVPQVAAAFITAFLGAAQEVS